MTEILNKVKYGEMTAKEAYKALYTYPKVRKPRRAGFIKMRIRVPDEKGVNRLLAVLFFFPIPLFVVRWGLRFVKNEHLEKGGIEKKDIMELIRYRGISVEVNAKGGEKVLVKTI